jgi:hypothetical protein
MSFSNRTDLIRFKRSTLPVYRDIRDRPVWEKLDTLYYNLVIDPDIVDILEFRITETFDLFYIIFSRLFRKTDLGEYTWDGSTICLKGFGFSSLNVTGRFNQFEDVRISLPDNAAQINCQAQSSQPSDDPFKFSETVVFSVDSATGPWSGATNCVMVLDSATGWREISVYRALN